MARVFAKRESRRSARFLTASGSRLTLNEIVKRTEGRWQVPIN
jgi:hypothetical protein